MCVALIVPSALAWRGGRTAPAARPKAEAAKRVAPARDARAEKPAAPSKAKAASLLLPVPMPQAGPEDIATYAADCTTPKSIFNLGETVCAKYANAPTYAFFALRRVTWINTVGFVFQPQDVTVSDDSVTFTIPEDAVSTEGFDRRGGWSVNLISTADGSVRATMAFTVKDPANAAANVAVYQISEGGAAVVQANSNITYTVIVANRGPDPAANVVVTHNAPTLSTGGPAPTFVDNDQLSGPAFTFPTDTTATIAELSVGAVARLSFTYNVPSGTPNFAVVEDIVEVTSTTTDPRTSDNSSRDVITVVGAAATAECTLDCPADIVVTANTTQGGQPGAVVNYGAAAVFGDCGAVTNNPPSGSFFPAGTHVITSSAETGGSCTFTVKVLDTPAPTITCPPNKTATAGVDGTATVDVGTPTFTASGGGTVVGVRSDGTPAVVDEDGTVITPATTPPLTDPYPTGNTGITWTVTDADGRTASCTQTVIVTAPCASDTESPTITAPADITVSTGPDNTGCSVALDDELGQAEAHDDCSVTVTVSGIPAGNVFPKGTTTLTYTATDGAGHTATDTQTVTVIDDTPPRIAAPADATYTCLSEVPAANPSQATRGDVFDENGNLLPPGPPFDNCSVPTVGVSESNNGGAGSASNPLIITRTYTATDSAGLTASASQTITVADGTMPTIIAPADVQAATDATSCSASNVSLGTAQTGDNCSVASVTNDAPATFPLGTTTVTWTVTDSAGNTATDTQVVTVVDQTPPVITVLGSNPATVLQGSTYTDAGATATDACSGSVAVNATGSVNTSVIGTYTITYTATDAAGNPATATRTVNVIYVFTGFFSPVANLPTFNSVKAGQTIAVKFSLNGNQGLGIMAAGFPASQPINCDSSAPLSELEGTETSGGSTLTYDSGSGQYHYNWKTEKSWAGTCRLLNVKLIDGTEHTALFKFK